MPNYMTTAQVVKLLHTSRPTLKRLMDSTPKGVRPPWRNTGTNTKRTYMWNADKIDDWLAALPTNGK